jgi:hypothetical protein
MRYAVWLTHVDGIEDELAPRTVTTSRRLQFGDELPLANVSCWITRVEERRWVSLNCEEFDGRAWAAAGPADGRFADDRSAERRRAYLALRHLNSASCAAEVGWEGCQHSLIRSAEGNGSLDAATG